MAAWFTTVWIALDSAISASQLLCVCDCYCLLIYKMCKKYEYIQSTHSITLHVYTIGMLGVWPVDAI